MKLEQADVAQLMQNNTPEAQMVLVEKMTNQYDSSGDERFSDEQSNLAEEIFRIMMKNAETQVRAVLSKQLKESKNLPHDIALSMAKDISEVSLPIITYSEILTEEDLIDIIQSTNDEDHHLAVALRKHVPEAVSEALVEKGSENVVTTLVRNEGAQIAEQTFDKIVNRHASNEQIVQSMIMRGSLPITVAEKMMDKVSDALKEQLREKFEGKAEGEKLNRVIDQGLDVATLKLMGLQTSYEDLAKMMKALGDHGKLSPFTALCLGDWHLFEVSMSRLARVPLNQVQKLLNDKGEEGFRRTLPKSRPS